MIQNNNVVQPKPQIQTLINQNISMQQNNKKYNYIERDLHPFLVQFAFDKLNNTYCKTIFLEKSNKAFNEWIHPDLVGFLFHLNHILKKF